MIFYRYSTYVHSNPYRYIEVQLEEFKLVKETPKGHWVTYDWDYDSYQKRWISKTSRKRYAYPTKEEAMTNYIKRTEKHIRILKEKLEDSINGLAIAKGRNNENKHNVQDNQW